VGCVAANIDITIYEGGTFDQTYQWKTGDPAVAVDLTGYSARMSVKKKITDTGSLLNILYIPGTFTPDLATGIYITNPSNGFYRVYIRDNDTLGLCVGFKDIIGVYDLFLMNSFGETVLKQYGTANIIAAVTRVIQ
jgi:hypothetical protein